MPAKPRGSCGTSRDVAFSPIYPPPKGAPWRTSSPPALHFYRTAPRMVSSLHCCERSSPVRNRKLEIAVVIQPVDLFLHPRRSARSDGDACGLVLPVQIHVLPQEARRRSGRRRARSPALGHRAARFGSSKLRDQDIWDSLMGWPYIEISEGAIFGQN
jgi:hypothetical protein